MRSLRAVFPTCGEVVCPRLACFVRGGGGGCDTPDLFLRRVWMRTLGPVTRTGAVRE